MLGKFSDKINRKEIIKAFVDYGLKRSSAKVYADELGTLCRHLKTTPEDILTLDLEEIEDRAELHTRKYNKGRIVNGVRIAPKRLNVQISALKAWLHLNRKIKNRKMFRELKFDKSSLLKSGLMAQTLEPRDMKKILQFANGEEDITLGFYGLSALRPSLIAYIKVKHIHPRSCAIKDGKIALKKPCLIIVPKEDEKGVPLEGNKANIDFPIFLCSVLTEKLENNLNQNTVTLETKLVKVDKKPDVDYIVRKYYKMIGFKGKPYRMRNFGSRTLKLIETQHNDHELKEYLCGHKVQTMSFIYDMATGLSESKELDWRTKYACVDEWISETIFSAQTQRVLDMGKAIADFAITLGVAPSQAKKVYELFEMGKMTLEQLRDRLRSVTMKTHREQMRGIAERVVSEKIKQALPNYTQKEGASK